MNRTDAIGALGALAHETRLDVFRLLVEAGPEGASAGEIGDALRIAPPTLSFHLKELWAADVVDRRRTGRSLVYRARFDTMNALVGYLTENCCRGRSQRRPATRH